MRTKKPLFIPAAGIGLAAVLAAAPSAADLHIRNIAATCYSCHGTDGKSESLIPALAGVKKADFVMAMQEFKTGKREATVMHQHAPGYTDEELEKLGELFSNLK